MNFDAYNGTEVLHAKSGTALGLRVGLVPDYESTEPGIDARRIELPGGASMDLEFWSDAAAADGERDGTVWVLSMGTPVARRRQGDMLTLSRWLVGLPDVRHVELGLLLEDGAAFFPVFECEAQRAGKTVDGFSDEVAPASDPVLAYTVAAIEKCDLDQARSYGPSPDILEYHGHYKGNDITLSLAIQEWEDFEAETGHHMTEDEPEPAVFVELIEFLLKEGLMAASELEQRASPPAAKTDAPLPSASSARPKSRKA